MERDAASENPDQPKCEGTSRFRAVFFLLKGDVTQLADFAGLNGFRLGAGVRSWVRAHELSPPALAGFDCSVGITSTRSSLVSGLRTSTSVNPWFACDCRARLTCND